MMSMDQRLASYLAGLGVDPATALDGWNILTAQRDGEDVGFVITKGPEIHMLSTNPRKAMSRKNILEYLGPIIEEFSYATTRVPIAEEDHRLRTILGFVMTWEDENYTYWALTELPFQRKPS